MMSKWLKNISNFNDTSDYLPILTSALIVDMAVIFACVLRYINIKSLNDWYNKFGLSAVLADVLSIVIGVILSRVLYPFVFGENNYSLVKFAGLSVVIQFTHDLLFYTFFKNVPRNKSAMLDVFQDYAKEVGGKILFADATMMVSTILLASILATWKTNYVIITAIIACYILPYFLYSLPTKK